MAYTWAPLPPGDKVAVRYPDGFEKKDDQGNELFMILEKCLYGMPSAAREWSKCRDSCIMRKISSDGGQSGNADMISVSLSLIRS